MSRVAPVLLLVGLLALVAAHVAIVVELLRARAWARGLLALIVPPLAPWWGWERGLRRRTIAWAAGLALYAVGVIVA